MEINLLNLFILLAYPFLFMGIINRVKAFWAGRKGPSLVQPFLDFVKLLKKGDVTSRTTSFIFQIGPLVYLASVFLSGLLLPILNHRSVIDFEGDFILFIYLLAAGRFVMLLAALDTGNSFEGMGASREATFSILVEPAFFIVLGALSAIKGFVNFDSIFIFYDSPGWLYLLIMGLGLVIFFIMLLVEGSRVPVDDPNTHLELTMVHEVMILDHSGVNLAFINYATAMKMVVISTIMVNLILPLHLNLLVYFAIYTGIIVGVAIMIGMVESLIARLRMTHVPQFIFLMSSIALILLASTILYIFGGKA